MSSMHEIQLDDAAYVNVSNGNLNVLVQLESGQVLRAVLGPSDTPPDATQELFLIVACPVGEGRAFFQVENLEAETDLWLRMETGEDAVVVVRGEAKFSVL